MDNKKEISRAEALRRLGSTVLGSTLLPSFMQGRTASGAGAAAASGKKPNILWITGEGVPVNALSCYGSRLIHTPNIDRIANEGMRFENSFCTNALCAPE